MHEFKCNVLARSKQQRTWEMFSSWRLSQLQRGKQEASEPEPLTLMLVSWRHG